MRRSTRRLSLPLVFLVSLGLFAVVVSIPQIAFAAFRGAGPGGCGVFADAVARAAAGDVLTPMRGGVNTDSIIISNTLVLQGGWVPDTADCNDNGSGGEAKRDYDDAADMLAAGFAFDADERSELFGDGSESALPLSLGDGQTLALENLRIGSQSLNASGAAISGVISEGARLRIENVDFSSNLVGTNNSGGAIYLEVRGGSQVVIADSIFNNNQAASGGAIEIYLYDGSELIIEGSTFNGNEALNADGGALKVVLYHGSVTIRNSTFSNNNATNGDGGAIRLERGQGANGPTTATLRNITYSGNSSEQAVTANISLAGVGVLEPQLYLPALFAGDATAPYSVRILGITLDEAQYMVSFNTSGYTPQLPGRHIHFYFNTVPAEQAGVPGSGPWKIYGGASPFTQYGITDRPAGATQLCALVANENHSVIQDTGNCVDLP
ncbi:MAG: hypothetical protein HC822_05240 [Oscillochloris sp.]|nr:hypothetical protein [Oscillochloris sp.]